MSISPQKLANIRSFHEEISSPQKDGSTSNAPLLLAIEATTRCNFKCVHCSHSFTDRSPAPMSMELFNSIIPMSKTAHEFYLFGDGEVLLDIPRHLAMISHIYQEDPASALGFSTNGKLLTPEVYELYSLAGIEYIQISIDAATKELYNVMRKGGDFDELLVNLEGIAALRRGSKATRPHLFLATVISKQNYRQLPMIAELAKRYDFSYWYINAEYPHNPGRDQLHLASEDLAELGRIRAAIAEKYSPHYLTVFDPSIGLPSAAGENWLTSASSVYCTVPWQRFELKVNGDIKICPYYHEPICSMNGKPFPEVWNGEEFRRIRRAFTSGTGIPPYCINCKLGMRTQYLPGYPGLPDISRTSLLDRMIRGVRTIREYIAG